MSGMMSAGHFLFSPFKSGRLTGLCTLRKSIESGDSCYKRHPSGGNSWRHAAWFYDIHHCSRL